MKHTKIENVKSYNQGIENCLDILRQHFFAGNIDGGNAAISQIEGMIMPVADNGVFTADVIPDSIPETFVEAGDILEKIEKS